MADADIDDDLQKALALSMQVSGGGVRAARWNEDLFAAPEGGVCVSLSAWQQLNGVCCI